MGNILKIRDGNNVFHDIPALVGPQGSAGFSPTVTTSKTGKVTTITITDATGPHVATINDGADGTASGDMLKSTYDTNNNGIVDNAEKVNNHTVESDVPSNAVFTDTTYSAGTGISIENNVISNTQTSAEWGNITGTLSSQTDLNTALNAKQATLVSGTNIKTINNNNILGSGNIEITSGSEEDNSSITKNSNDKLQTVGVIDQKTTSTDKFWTGTTAEYNALSSKDNNTIYFITDDGVDMDTKENISNKVTTISSSSTDTQYPSAKCVYDLMGDIETLLGGI